MDIRLKKKNPLYSGQGTTSFVCFESVLDIGDSKKAKCGWSTDDNDDNESKCRKCASELLSLRDYNTSLPKKGITYFRMHAYGNRESFLFLILCNIIT